MIDKIYKTSMIVCISLDIVVAVGMFMYLTKTLHDAGTTWSEELGLVKSKTNDEEN